MKRSKSSWDDYSAKHPACEPLSPPAGRKTMYEARRNVLKLKSKNENLRRKTKLKTTQRKLQRSRRKFKDTLTPKRKKKNKYYDLQEYKKKTKIGLDEVCTWQISYY